MQIQINTMCVCISLSAYVTLFCLFSPKLSIILLHPDKNVRKLTMNSATYKRPFKPVSSFASADGRPGNNLTGGHGNDDANCYGPGTGAGATTYTYGAPKTTTDGGSGGPMSTTSNVLNLGGEFNNNNNNNHNNNNNNQLQENERTGCFGFACDCKFTGVCCSEKNSIITSLTDCGPTCCWLTIRRFISQCCSLGDVGPTMTLELDSYLQRSPSSSSSTSSPNNNKSALSRGAVASASNCDDN